MRVHSLCQTARNTWLMIGLTVGLLCLLEVGSRLCLKVAASVGGSEGYRYDPRELADCFDGAEWATDYFGHLKQCGHYEWTPYTYWSRSPYRSEMINIDANGYRETPGGGRSAGPGQVKIYMFGGSTVWGTGARDDHTIPAALSASLQELGITAEVRNFGESGYVTTQDLMRLMLVLRDEAAPDLVIFYGGFNDVFSAYQQGAAGIPQNEFHRRTEFNLSHASRSGELQAMSARGTVESLALTRLLRGVGRRIIGQQDAAAPASQEVDGLAPGVAKSMWANYRNAQALGESHGFDTLFVLQPALVHKTQRSEYEASLAKTFDTALERMLKTTYDAVLNQSAAAGNESATVVDLREIFGNEQSPVFFDMCHLSEAGNHVVATAIARAVKSRLGSRFEAEMSAKLREPETTGRAVTLAE